MPFRNFITICVIAVLSFACYTRADRNRYGATLSEAMNLVTLNYLEEVGYRELYENAMRGMTRSLDPYSSYIAPSDYQHFQEDLDQEFGGIGIMIEFDRETKRLTVVSPLVDTPAARAGVRAGDIILEIDGEDTADMSFRDAFEMIRGRPGDPVRLKLLHRGEEQPVELEIRRATIPVDSVLGDARRPDGHWDFRLQSDPRITYIRLVNFGENTVEELQKVFAAQRPEAVLLDLRDNAGGLLPTAVNTCDLFIDRGTIVTIRGRDGQIRESFVASSNTAIPADVPMAVLVNDYSASASEIVAACLQDHRRAKIIGQRTYGKGTVQNVIAIEGGNAALKLTTASYWRPSGKNIHRVRDAEDEDEWGVRPDEGFDVELTDEDADQVRQARRGRDGFRSAAPTDDNPKPDPKTAPPDPAPTPAPPFVDPQLRRAVEYLEQQLGTKAKSA